MTDRETLIEYAADAIRDAWQVRTMRPLDERPGLAETAAESALAVFEKAQAESPYEHWALNDHVRRAVMLGLGMTPFPRSGETFDATAMVERVLKSLAETNAGDPRGEPSDAQVSAFLDRFNQRRDETWWEAAKGALRAAWGTR